MVGCRDGGLGVPLLVARQPYGWFLADGKLRTVAASGDPVQLICDALPGRCGS